MTLTNPHSSPGLTTSFGATATPPAFFCTGEALALPAPDDLMVERRLVDGPGARPGVDGASGATMFTDAQDRTATKILRRHERLAVCCGISCASESRLQL